MFQLADELAADNEESRMEQRASEIQSTSKNSPYSRKWYELGYCNNNKTSTICNLCKKYFFFTYLQVLYNQFSH